MIAVICSACFIICSFLTVVDAACFDKAFYAKEHRTLTLYKPGTSSVSPYLPLPEYIGTDEAGLDHMTDVLLGYLRDEYDTLDLQMEIEGKMREIFTDDEKSHMVDVKILYERAVIVRNLTLIIFLISAGLLYYFTRKDFFRVLFGSYKKTLIGFGVVLAALGLAIFIDFDRFWTSFHHLFFSNDLWLLDLRTDILIMIVPPDFFNHLCLRIFFLTVAVLAGSYFLLSVLAKKVTS